MSQSGLSQGLMNIGDEAKPAYAVLPDPSQLFLNRSKRLRSIASGHVLEAYLKFVGDLAAAQHETQACLGEAARPNPAPLEQALEHGMPPFSRAVCQPDDAARSAVTTLLKVLAQADLSKETAAAVERLVAAPTDRLNQSIIGALGDLPPDDIAERVLVLAGLQVHFSGLAALLVADDLKPIADGICPVCGSVPMSSSVVGWPGAHNTRYCACSLCGTMWNVVRVKCVLCSSTEGISYHSIDEGFAVVKAETCDVCNRYVKILYQVKDHMLDPLSDDVATLGLDIALAEQGVWKRGGQNPFLLGY
jgi:FdhE protein